MLEFSMLLPVLSPYNCVDFDNAHRLKQEAQMLETAHMMVCSTELLEKLILGYRQTDRHPFNSFFPGQPG